MLFSVKGPLETYYALHALNACVLYDSMVLPMANRSSALKFCVLEIRPSSGYYIQNPLAIPLIFGGRIFAILRINNIPFVCKRSFGAFMF